MNKNLVIGLLALVVVIETGYLAYKHFSRSSVMTSAGQRGPGPGTPEAGPNTHGGKQMMLSKGSNLNTSALKPFAYQIAPGPVPDTSKQKLTGFSIASTVNADGSTTVTLTPKNSEDQNQQYTVKPGQILYFIEQTPADDIQDSDTDLNYRDDYGIITDANGIIQ